MQIVPLQPQPNQQLKVVLNQQNCQMAIYLKNNHLYVDLNVNGAAIFNGAIARNLVLLNPRPYALFSGDLLFVDTQGNDDPTYDGLGSRYQLVYLEDSERALLLQ